ncbi:MAG: hypothetical protein Q7R87_02160 [Nanoarchaeota archaeon]|nr:hypothetical protein [Nanoarchaeota archaeon]
MSLDIEAVLVEEHAKLDRMFKINRSLIIFTGEITDKHLKELEEIARLRGKTLDARSAYDLTVEAVKYLDSLVNPVGFQLGLLDLPRGKDSSLTSVLGWSKYNIGNSAGMAQYKEFTTEKGQSIHKNYCGILDIPQKGRAYPLARLLSRSTQRDAVGGIRPTGGG